MLWDVQGQKLSGLALVGFVVSEIKSRIPAQGERMTKAEEFDKARRLAYKGDFSLVEKLYHPDCTHFDHRVGMELNFDMQSAVMSAYENITFGPYRVITRIPIFYAYTVMSEIASHENQIIWP